MNRMISGISIYLKALCLAASGFLALNAEAAITMPTSFSDKGCQNCHKSQPIPSLTYELLAGTNNFSNLAALKNHLISKRNMGLVNPDQDILTYLTHYLFGQLSFDYPQNISPTWPGTNNGPDYALDFGTGTIGTSKNITITITNNRTDNISFDASLSAVSGTSFGLGGNAMCNAAPSTPCQLLIKYTPNNGSLVAPPQTETGVATINIDGVVHTLNLTGSPQAPATLSSTAIQQWQVQPGGISEAKETFFVNNGGAPATISGVAISSPLQFSRTAPTAGSPECKSDLIVAARAKCYVKVNFTPPTTEQDLSANLAITYDNGITASNTATLSLSASVRNALQSQISATPILAFGTVGIGTSKTLSATVTSIGKASLLISSIQKSSAAVDYTISTNSNKPCPIAPQALQPPNSCVVDVTFTPSSADIKDVVDGLRINSNASLNGTVVIPFTGTGQTLGPRASLNVTTLDFGSQTVNATYPSKTLTLTNTGTSALNISAVNITPSTNFTSQSNCTSLGSGQSCTISVDFVPTSANSNITASLSIVSDSISTTPSTLLKGTAVTRIAAALVWSPPPGSNTLDFGIASVGAQTTPQLLTLYNSTSGSAAHFGSIGAIGIDAASFSISSSGCLVAGPLQGVTSCKVEVLFTPTSAGEKTATLKVVSDGSAPTEITLHGIATATPDPKIALSSTALEFGTVKLGSESQTQEIQFDSTGSSALRITGLTLTDDFKLASSTCGALPFVLPSGSTCKVTVSFKPTTGGNSAGKLTVAMDGPEPSTEIALSGTGDAPLSTSSGGGCSVVDGDDPYDPTLWLLLLSAFAVLVARRQRGEAQRARVRRV